MSDVILNPLATGASLLRVTYDQIVANGLVMSMNLAGATSAAATFSTGSSSSSSLSQTMDELHMHTNVSNSFSLSGVRFSRGGQDYVVKASGDVQVSPSPITGVGTSVGTMTPSLGEVVINSWALGSAPAVSNFRAVAAAPVNGDASPFKTYAITFRVPTAPIRVGSLSVLGTMQDGTTFNVTADSDGHINATRVKGKVNYTTGVVTLVGVTPTGAGGQTQADLSFLGISGLTNAYVDLIQQETVRFNAVAYTYLPLDASLLGIDPVRLPSDGRVPIFRPAGFAVVGETFTTSPATAVNGGTVNTGHTRLSRVRVIGQNGATITTGYTEDLEAGTVTWTDVTGYSQPVRVESRIEDMAQLRDAAIDGTLTFLRALTHNFSTAAYISSAIVMGDTHSRVSLLFDQATWSPQTFTDALVGATSAASFNNISFPPVVTNNGAVTERWAFLFRTTTSVDVIGEHLGNLGTFSINTVIAPVDPITGNPFFTMPIGGWGSGWPIGSVVRMNTVAAVGPVWIARTIKQGPEAGTDYSFTLLARGDIDNPI